MGRVGRHFARSDGRHDERTYGALIEVTQEFHCTTGLPGSVAFRHTMFAAMQPSGGLEPVV